MSNISIYDRVKQFSDSTGTGNFALGDTAQGFMPFSSALQDGEMFFYAINDNTRFEIGSGVYIATSDSFVRHCMSNSNGDTNNVNFPAGRKEVFITYPASQAVTKTSLPDLSKAVDYSKTFTFPVPSFNTATKTISFDWPEISGVNIASGYSIIHTVKNSTFGGVTYQQVPHSISMIHATLSENGTKRNLNFHFYNGEELVVGGGDATSDDDDVYASTTPFTLTVNVDAEFENYPSVVLAEEQTTATTTTSIPNPVDQGNSSFVNPDGDSVYTTVSKSYSPNADLSNSSDNKVVNLSLSDSVSNPDNDTILVQAQAASGGPIVTIATLPVGETSASVTFPITDGNLGTEDYVNLRMVYSSNSELTASSHSFINEISNTSSAERTFYHGGQNNFFSVTSHPDNTLDYPPYTEYPNYNNKQTIDGDPVYFTSFARLPAGAAMGNIVSVVASPLSTFFAINDRGELYSWGANGLGQCGQGTTTFVRNPTKVINWRKVNYTGIASNSTTSDLGYTPNIVKIDASSNRVVAISDDGKIFVWGFTNSKIGGAITVPTAITVAEILKTEGYNTALNGYTRGKFNAAEDLQFTDVACVDGCIYALAKWYPIAEYATTNTEWTQQALDYKYSGMLFELDESEGRFKKTYLTANSIDIGDSALEGVQKDAWLPLFGSPGLYISTPSYTPTPYTIPVANPLGRITGLSPYAGSSPTYAVGYSYTTYSWPRNEDFNFSSLHSGTYGIFGVVHGRDYRASKDPHGNLDGGRIAAIKPLNGINFLSSPGIVSRTLPNRVGVGLDFLAFLSDDNQIVYVGKIFPDSEVSSSSRIINIPNVTDLFVSKNSNTLAIRRDGSKYIEVFGQNNGFISTTANVNVNYNIQSSNNVLREAFADLESPYELFANRLVSLGAFASTDGDIDIAMNDKNFYLVASKFIGEDLSNNGQIIAMIDDAGQFNTYSKNNDDRYLTNWGIVDMLASGTSSDSSGSYNQPSGTLAWGFDRYTV